jgi:hypothetical protein
MRAELIQLDALSAIRREVRPAERLLWSGVPRPDGFRRRVRQITRFGKVFAGFALFWMAVAAAMLWVLPPASGIEFKSDSGETIPVFLQIGFPLFGTPFLLVGVWLARAGTREARRAGRTAYAITDQRAIIWECSGNGVVRCESLDGREVRGADRTELPDGSGDLVFSAAADREGAARLRVNGVPVSTVGFFGVENVREVDRLLAMLASGSSPGAS